MVKRLMLGVRVTDEMMTALKIEAAKERRTVSAWVENLLFDDLCNKGHMQSGYLPEPKPKRTKK